MSNMLIQVKETNLPIHDPEKLVRKNVRRREDATIINMGNISPMPQHSKVPNLCLKSAMVSSSLRINIAGFDQPQCIN